VDGFWYVQLETPYEDVFGFTVEVGPPATDVVEAIADAVWAEELPNGFPAGSAGYIVSDIDTKVSSIQKSIIAADLLVEAGSTTLVLNTNATQGDSFYDGLQLVICNASGTVARRIVSYANVDGAFTLLPALPFSPADGDRVIVLGRLGEVAVGSDSESAVKLCEIHRILGLDSEAPLCVSKTSQSAGGITLTHKEIGKKVTVTREP
jgi:hypothetical protein